MVRVVLLAGLLACIAFPFYCMLVTSIRPKVAAFELVPRDVTLSAYGSVLEDLRSHIRNSFAVATTTVALTIAFGAAAAYAIARFRFPGKRAAARFFVLVYAFPAVLLVIPLFVLWARVGWVGKLPPLVLAYLAQTLPVAIYLFTNYFESQDESVEEAALLDGCSPLGVIWHITIPTSLPAVAAVGIFTFVVAWNEFLFAYSLLRGNSGADTLPVKLYQILQSAHFPWGELMAASIILILPVLVLMIAGQRYFEQGVVSGGK